MKKLGALLLAMLILFQGACIPLEVRAELQENDFPKKEEIVLEARHKDSPKKLSLRIDYMTAGSVVKNLKSSNKKVVSVSKEADNIILLAATKWGKAKISFDIVDKSTGQVIAHRSCKVTVKKYSNPFNCVKLNGKNITALFNDNSWSYLNFNEKDVKISVKMKKGYKLTGIRYDNGKSGKTVKNGKTFVRTNTSKYAGELSIFYEHENKGGFAGISFTGSGGIISGPS